MAYPTAEQVQNANTVPLPIAQIGAIGEQLAQNRVLADKRRKDRQAQQIQGLGLIGDAIDPLSKGTGYSPYDDLNSAHLGEVKQKATQMVMAGADPASTYMYLQNATNGLRARQADLTKYHGLMQDVAKREAAKNINLDPDLLLKGFEQNGLYSTDTNGNKSFNPNFNSNADFTRGILDSGLEAQLPYMNPIALNSNVPDVLSKRLPPQSTSIQGIDPTTKRQGRYTADIAPYYNIDPQTGKTYIPGNKVTLEDAHYVGATPEAVNYLKADPTLHAKLLMDTKDLSKVFPKADKGDVEAAAAYHILQTHGTKGDAVAKFDDYVSKLQDEQRKEAKADANNAERLRLAREAGARGEKSLKLREDGKVGYVSPYDITTGWATGNAKASDNTQAGNMLKIHTHTVNGVRLVDVNGIAEKDVLTDPDTGNPAKIVGFTDPHTRSKGYQVIYMRKSTPKEMSEGSDAYVPLLDENDQPKSKTIRGNDFNRYHTALAPQLQLDTKKKNYNATLSSASGLIE